MKHQTTAEFWRYYNALPSEVRELADKAFSQLRADPKHPALHFKNVGSFWSARVGGHFRALAINSGDTWVWFWIGTHGDYDRLNRGR